MKMETEDVIVESRVPNPLSTWAQFLHELETGMIDPGLNRAQVNRTTQLGGFARFHGNEAQNEAVARFKALWEASQIGGARAIDPSVEPVDGGWLNPEATFDRGVDARIEYDKLSKHLGRVDHKRLYFVVVGEWGPTSYAKWRFHVRTPNARHVQQGQVEVRRLADKVAKFLKLSS